MGQNKAVTVDRIIKMNPLTEKDRTGIVIGKMGIKHFALSFANNSEDVRLIRSITGKDSLSFLRLNVATVLLILRI